MMRVIWMSAIFTVLAATGIIRSGPDHPAVRSAASDERPVVVVARPGHIPAARAQVAAAGGHLTRDLALVDGFAAVVPAHAVAGLRASPEIRSLTPDTAVRVASLSQGGLLATADVSEPTSVYPQAMGANRVWQAGDRGQGVTVAVIDTGISSSTDLSGRMVSVSDGLLSPTTPCKNLSGEPTCQDNYGHGTFVGGVIAGDGTASGGTYSGVAPQANLLSVKVAGADGSTDVSNVLAAIQWVVSYRSKYSIRVLNLSLSTDSTQTYRTDPFNYAVERAWDNAAESPASAGLTGTTSPAPFGIGPTTATLPI